MSYVFSKRSLRELEGVHEELVRLCHAVIEIVPVDFGVHDGIRTVDEQREHVRRGVSWTMNSMHLPQQDGFGHAVDLVPYVNGRLRWEWEPIYDIARSVRLVAEQMSVEIEWGGCWHVINETQMSPEEMMWAYCDRQRARGRKPRPDGPHFQLSEKYRPWNQ